MVYFVYIIIGYLVFKNKKKIHSFGANILFFWVSKVKPHWKNEHSLKKRLSFKFLRVKKLSVSENFGNLSKELFSDII